MSSSTPASNSTAWTAEQARAGQSASPWRRTWRRFRAQPLGYWSFVIFAALFALSLGADVLSNDRPLVLRYDGHYYFPILKDYPETQFGGDFPAKTNYLDPHIREKLDARGNLSIYPPNRFRYDTIDYFASRPYPAPPSASNWLGTDQFGRDVLARLLYGFRLSVLMALALTASGTLIGVLAGALQGFYGGRTDLIGQRLIEIWSALPDLYLLIIFASIFEPSLWLLFVLLSMFGWLMLSDYVRAEFLRNRGLDYVKAARTMGLTNRQIMWRHVLPNSLTPVITFLPFRMSAAILSLTSLDFLGLGVQPPTPSLGELLKQGKNNLDAWWISVSAFAALVVTLLLLTFMGDALRNALDARTRGSAFGGGR
ncbi:peptide ABC transporter permease [Burkholderia ubonensis]|uniref:ABC transporter permease n=1 Tax=Burkholderia ubonensis TaxID=101571 RepID=UPI00075BA4BC|nr:ABC transporter permease [Burkholderia ubonensis]KVV52534.1 peptide ABC transporter permease [Burkholderia ubonensis]KVW30619.1 peptide ABC transporter permease [Burkholderia ubonensis]